MEQNDLLLELEKTPSKRLTAIVRLANFIVDFVMCRIVFVIITVLLEIVFGSAFNNFFVGMNRFENVVTGYLFLTVSAILYYTIAEGSTRGRTIGKLVTGTRARMNDGSYLTWKAAFLRSLVRVIPFEPFSTFSGYPWHDSWTKTEVVRVRR